MGRNREQAKRILIATGVYPPEIGGPATHTALLERELPKRGFSVAVLPFREVRHLPKVLRHIVFLFKALARARRADVILAQDTVSVGAPALLAALILRKRFIVRVAGDHAWEQGGQRFGVADTIDDFQHKRYGVRLELLRYIQRLVACTAHAVVTPSDYFKHIVAGWGVQGERIRTIYNGIDLEVEAVPPKDAPDGRIAVSAGRLVPWKGFGMLIRLLPRVPEWHLVIIGDGPERSGLEALAKEAGVRDRVSFTGSLPRKQVFGWYTAADAFALNTSFESFSYQVIEAMACGVPVIATKIGSIPELITDGREGVLLAPDDEQAFEAALRSITESTDAWRGRTDAAKRKAEQFSIERTVGAFAELFVSE